MVTSCILVNTLTSFKSGRDIHNLSSLGGCQGANDSSAKYYSASYLYHNALVIFLQAKKLFPFDALFIVISMLLSKRSPSYSKWLGEKFRVSQL